MYITNILFLIMFNTSIQYTNNQYDMMFSLLDDTVVCINANTEIHHVTNSGYETVYCSWSSSYETKFMLFLIPPKTVSNIVSCQFFGDKKKICPTPWRFETDRGFETSSKDLKFQIGDMEGFFQDLYDTF